MESQPYFIRIDPYTETICRIDAEDSYGFLARQVSARHIGVYNVQPYQDVCIMNAEAMVEQPFAPAWIYQPTGEIYLGIALWLNISPEGTLRTPIMREDNLEIDIKFIGFITPSITTTYESLSENDSKEDIQEGDYEL